MWVKRVLCGLYVVSAGATDAVDLWKFERVIHRLDVGILARHEFTVDVDR